MIQFHESPLLPRTNSLQISHNALGEKLTCPASWCTKISMQFRSCNKKINKSHQLKEKTNQTNQLPKKNTQPKHPNPKTACIDSTGIINSKLLKSDLTVDPHQKRSGRTMGSLRLRSLYCRWELKLQFLQVELRLLFSW